MSVIVAAYQVEEYVENCLDSILQAKEAADAVCQADFAEMEVLVVLGNSKDRTDDICKSYEKRGLLCCVMQDKEGLSNARNCGMRMAKGAYLAFVDADDWLDAGCFAACIRHLEKLLRKNRYDVVANDFWYVDKDGNRLFGSGQIPPFKEAGVLGSVYAQTLIQSKGTFWNIWRYIYRTGYLRERKRAFWEGRCCEDLDFAVRTFLDTGRTAFVHIPYYCYCPVRPQSLMHSKNLKMLQDFWLMERRLLACCMDNPSPLAAAAAEKLKELAVLNLPDIWEVPKSSRKTAAYGYRKLFMEMELPQRHLARLAVWACRRGLVHPASLLLYVLKHLRRGWRYHRKSRKAKKENTKRRRAAC